MDKSEAMVDNCIKHTRDKSTIKTEPHTLLNAKDSLKVGDWVQFTQVGRISEMTTYKDSETAKVVVEIKSDSYKCHPTALTEEYYECSTCGRLFDLYHEFDSHWWNIHRPKPKRKPRKKKQSK